MNIKCRYSVEKIKYLIIPEYQQRTIIGIVLYLEIFHLHFKFSNIKVEEKNRL